MTTRSQTPFHRGSVPTVHWSRLLPIFVHPYRGYQRLHARHGKTFVVAKPDGRQLVFTADEALAWRIIVDCSESVIRPPNVVRNIFRTAVGEGIVTARGSEWQEKRQQGSRHVRGAVVSDQQIRSLQGCLRDFLAEVREQTAASPRVDMLPLIERFTLDVAIQLICQRRVERKSEEFTELLDALRCIMDTTQHMVDLRKQMFLYSLVPHARKVVDRARYRQMEAPVRMVARFEPDPDVRELFMATYENPSTCLGWTLMWLAMHPACQERLRREAAAVDILSEGKLTVEALDELTYADAVIRESARLNPPIAYLARRVTADIDLGELTIRKGANVIIVPWCLHMAPDRWENPGQFNPDRFLGEPSPEQGRLWSFGFGPRACVGTRFAMQFLKAAIVALAGEMRWSLAPGFRPRPPTGRYPWNEKSPCSLTIGG